MIFPLYEFESSINGTQKYVHSGSYEVSDTSILPALQNLLCISGFNAMMKQTPETPKRKTISGIEARARDTREYAVTLPTLSSRNLPIPDGFYAASPEPAGCLHIPILQCPTGPQPIAHLELLHLSYPHLQPISPDPAMFLLWHRRYL